MSVFGFGLPPGVSHYDIDRAECGGLDPYQTYIFRCQSCEWEIREKPDNLPPTCPECGHEFFEAMED